MLKKCLPTQQIRKFRVQFINESSIFMHLINNCKTLTLLDDAAINVSCKKQSKINTIKKDKNT